MSSPWAISLTDVETGRFTTFASLIQAADFLGRSKPYVKMRISNDGKKDTAKGKDGKEYIVRLEGIGRKRDDKRLRRPPSDEYTFDGCEIRHHTGNSVQLCTDCARASGFCAWSQRLQPVEGWDAIPTKVKHYTRHASGTTLIIADTYRIKGCPLFIRDAETAEGRKKQRKMLMKELEKK